MNFRTQVEWPERQTEIRHSDRMVLLGSCFAENIGNLLADSKFRCDVNPFGILYNPLSIGRALSRIMERRPYTEEELFFSQGLWHSWMHHSDFSAPTSEECLERINSRLMKAADGLLEADWLVMTWGTAYVYIHRESGEVVGNCHKMPDKTFRRLRLDAGTLAEECRSVLEKCREANPKLKVLFTVSPIRHARDGMHANQLSKAALLLAVDELCRTCPGCFYFPSYEIMMDELRDYRFYADDMLHPSKLAVGYIWECFSKAFFPAETLSVLHEWEEIRKGMEHKPFRPDSEAYRKFLSQIVLKITRIKEKMPYLEVQKELELCECRLKI